MCCSPWLHCIGSWLQAPRDENNIKNNKRLVSRTISTRPIHPLILSPVHATRLDVHTSEKYDHVS